VTLFAILIYGVLFAGLYAWGVVWILERRDRKYRQGTTVFTDAFLTGSWVLLSVYISNIIVMLRWPSSAVTYDLVLLAGLAAFAGYRELLYRGLHSEVRRKLRAEARLLEQYMKKDPGNAALWERASEIYEELGEHGKAVEAARAAAELDPTVRNSWRFRTLLEDADQSAGGKGRGRPS
jgi:tetratricopeptide (TPR) repeat protein